MKLESCSQLNGFDADKATRSVPGADEAATHRTPQKGGVAGGCARAASPVCARIAPEQMRTRRFAAGADYDAQISIHLAQDRGLGPQEAVSARTNRCARDPPRPLAPALPAGYVSGARGRRQPHLNGTIQRALNSIDQGSSRWRIYWFESRW